MARPLVSSRSKSILGLIALPRSGSTFVRKLMAQKLSNTVDLGEYFFSDAQQYRCNADGFLSPVHDVNEQPVWGPGDKVAYKKIVAWEKTQLTTLKKATRGQYLLKINPIYSVFDEVVNIVESIFLFRRNIYENLLSYGLSAITGRWHEKGGLNFKDERFVFPLDEFVRFVAAHEKCWQLTTRFSRAPVLFFEDILQDNGLTLFGQRYPILESDMKHLPEVQNKSDKQQYFQNIQEVRSWYRMTSLQSQWPISDEP